MSCIQLIAQGNMDFQGLFVKQKIQVQKKCLLL